MLPIRRRAIAIDTCDILETPGAPVTKTPPGGALGTFRYRICPAKTPFPPYCVRKLHADVARVIGENINAEN